jgi:hypothetical protein
MFLTLLLLITSLHHNAFGSENHLPQWSQDAAELENYLWEESSHFTHAQHHQNDLNYDTQFDISPHDTFSTITPYPFNPTYNQLDSSAWGTPGNLGFDQYAHNTPAAPSWDFITHTGMSSSSANLPPHSYHHPVVTEAYGVPEHGISPPTVWQEPLASANGHDWRYHLDPVSNVVPNSNHDPTGSMIVEALKDYSPNSLAPPTLAFSLSEPATSFGLPIEWFTREFFREARISTEAAELAEPATKGGMKRAPKRMAQGSTQGAPGNYDKLESHLRDLEAGQPVVIHDDTKLHDWSRSYFTRKIDTDDLSAVRGRRTRYFFEHREIWLDFWEAQTGIDLKSYVDQIQIEPYKLIFPLFLFYIEIITLILPRTKMEGLENRCQWFVNVANSVPKHRLLDPQKDSEIAQILFRKKADSNIDRNVVTWIILFAWIKQYRPQILPQEAFEPPFRMTVSIKSLWNTLFMCSVVKLTEECNAFLSKAPKHL